MNHRVIKLSWIALFAIISAVSAQLTSVTDNTAQQEVINFKSVRFANALVERWMCEYSKICPEIAMSFAGRDANEHSIEIAPVGLRKGNTRQDLTTTVSFGRFAVLPISGKDNVFADDFRKRKLNEKRIKELFFEKDILDRIDEPNKKNSLDVTVYSAANANSVSHLFAGHFGYEASSLKGKRIAGDDIFLNSAVLKDEKGVSFNNLNYIYNVETRTLNDGIVTLPLDVRKEFAEILNLQNLDETIALLESRSIDLIPVAELAFVLPKDSSPAILQFVEWALSQGQDYIRQFGFLRLDESTITQQQEQISELKTRHYLALLNQSLNK